MPASLAAAADAPMEARGYLPIKAAARRAGVSLGTLYRWQREQRLPIHAYAGRAYVLAADLDALLPPPAPPPAGL